MVDVLLPFVPCWHITKKATIFYCSLMVHIAQFVCISFARMSMWWEQIKTHRLPVLLHTYVCILCAVAWWCCCCCWRENNVYIYIWLLTDIFSVCAYVYHRYSVINLDASTIAHQILTVCVYRWNKVTFDFTPANLWLFRICEHMHTTHVECHWTFESRNSVRLFFSINQC